MASAGTLGILAGGGELPAALAKSVRAGGRSVYLVALEGFAVKDEVARFPHEWVSLGELGKALKLFKDAGCSEVTLAGKVTRPQFGALKLDAAGALALPKIVAAAMKGDDALLRTMIGIFEEKGFRVVGTAEAAPDLLMPAGPLGRLSPDARAQDDIALGVQVVRALGKLDVGQAAAVCEGLVLVVEAAEGTDAMLARIADLSENIRGTPAKKRGVLVKAPKPHQERRLDLPVVGVRTMERAAEAGLAGVALEAGSSLVMDRREVGEAADRLGLFVVGFAAGAYPP
jgi:UDP-2,3-diacylglucosamine hydrolase